MCPLGTILTRLPGRCGLDSCGEVTAGVRSRRVTAAKVAAKLAGIALSPMHLRAAPAAERSTGLFRCGAPEGLLRSHRPGQSDFSTRSAATALPAAAAAESAVAA